MKSADTEEFVNQTDEKSDDDNTLTKENTNNNFCNDHNDNDSDDGWCEET